MRVCLINPSSVSDNSQGSALSTRNKYFINPYNIPHAGIGYIASTLNKNGFPTDILECARLGLKEKDICDIIIKEGYDIVGITAYFFNYTQIVRIVKKLKSMKPSLFIILGGYLPTLSYDLLLNNLDSIDCCVIGEGENSTLELLQKLEQNQNWKDTVGIAYKEADKVVFTGKRDLIEDLDTIEFPVRPFISERKIATMITSRGCYGHCVYCGVREFYNTCNGSITRRRSPENVVEEIELLIKNHDLKYLRFIDDNFHISSEKGRNWFAKFYQLVKEKNIKLKFLANFRADEIVKSQEILKQFVEIGLIFVNVGIESLLQKQLDFFNKKISVEDNINAIKTLEALQIKFTINTLVFDPIITVPEILQYLNVFKEIEFYKEDTNIHPPTSIASHVIATTGTPIHNYVVENGLVASNETNYVFKDPKTALCFEVIKKWTSKLNPIFNKNYISYIADDNNKEEMYASIKKLYQRLFNIDLDFFIELCREIIKSDNSEAESYDHLISKWEADLASIDAQITQLESELIKYY